MNQGKVDRRVKYTIMMLKDALVQSMLTRHISKISVKSLCEMADINRSTFYAHFSDQYDLLRHIEQEVIDKIMRHLDEQLFTDILPVSAQVLTKILEYVQEDPALFKALLSDNCEPDIQLKIIDLAQVLPIKRYNDLDKHTADYLIMYGTTGCVSILKKWLHDDMPESAAEIAELIMKVLHNGIGSFE